MKYLVLITLSFFIFSNVNAQYSREEAINIVKEEVIGADSTIGIHFYSKYDILNQGDTLHLDFYMGYYICPYSDTWVFFIDDMPVAYWSHPCRIVFFNSTSGEYQIIDEDWSPFPFLDNIYDFYNQWEWIIFNEVTREEAIEIVIDEVIGEDFLEYKQLFSRYKKFMYNDTLWMFEGDYYHIYNQYKAWIFFIDDAPMSNWAHPCRVVFVNPYPSYNIQYTITEDQWPPDPYLENYNLFLEQWQWITTVNSPENNLASTDFKVFPNPCIIEISIQCKKGLDTSSDIFISDITGKTIQHLKSKNITGSVKINTSDLKNGLYFINVFENGKLIYQEKFLKLN